MTLCAGGEEEVGRMSFETGVGLCKRLRENCRLSRGMFVCCRLGGEARSRRR